MEPIRVFLAEADPSMRRLIQGFFTEQDDLLLCGQAGDGHEALTLIEQTRPHVLLLSLELPGLDGLTVLRRLKEHPPQPPLSVVVVSRFADQQVIHYALSLGVQYYLIKPVSYCDLLQTIRRLAQPAIALKQRGASLLQDMLSCEKARQGKPSKGLLAAASAAAALAEAAGKNLLLKEAYYDSISTEHTDYACVEKNIRYLVTCIHTIGSERYQAMMGGLPTTKPDNDTFLRALAHLIGQD